MSTNFNPYHSPSSELSSKTEYSTEEQASNDRPMHEAKLVYINPLRSATTLALVACVACVPLVGIMKFFQLFDPRPQPNDGFGWLAWIVVPVAGCALIFLCTLFLVAVFNVVARVTGGVPYKSVK